MIEFWTGVDGPYTVMEASWPFAKTLMRSWDFIPWRFYATAAQRLPGELGRMFSTRILLRAEPGDAAPEVPRPQPFFY